MPTAGWSGYWQRQFGIGHSLNSKYTTKQWQMSRQLRTGIGGRKLRAIVMALTGATVGSASKAYSSKRIPHDRQVGVATSQFGKITAVTVTHITGNTTANDLSVVDNVLAARTRPPTYPTSRGGPVLGKPGSYV